MTKEDYFTLGKGHGVVARVIAFVVAWIYCTITYGFLLGFGLGWLPAGILAYLVDIAFIFLWLPIDVVAGLLVWYLVLQLK